MADGSSSPAYEQFCLLAKSQRGRAVVALIQQVLNKEHIYVFGELLAMENIQALRETESAEHLRLLELFAYGTYAEYTTAPSGTYPELSKKMMIKLRQLSLVSLAHASKKVSYEELQLALGITNVRELEDLIIDTIYAGILEGRLDQLNGVLNVKSAMARDVRPEAVAELAQKLKAWGGQVQHLLAAFEQNMAQAAASRAEEAKTRAETLSQIDSAKKAQEKRAGVDVNGGDDLGAPGGGASSSSSRPKRTRDGPNGGGGFPGEGKTLGGRV